MSHAGLALLRQPADRIGLTAGLSRALPSPLWGHDRGRVVSDLACAIADGARVISDFRVMGDQRELFGPVASVPTAWRSLKEIAGGGDRMQARIAAAVNRARRHAWAQAAARHGGLPPVRVADKTLEGITRCSLPAITPPSRWRGCCARARRAATRPPITCGCCGRRSRRCRRRSGAG